MSSRQMLVLVLSLAVGCDGAVPSPGDGGAPPPDAAGGDAELPGADAAALSDGGTPLHDGGGAGDPDGGDPDGGDPDGGDPESYVRPTRSESCDAEGYCWVEPRLGRGALRGVYRVGDDALWAVGLDGMIAHHEAGVLTFAERLVEHRLNAIDGRAPNDLWVVGAAGTALHFDGTEWTRVSTGVSVELHGVWVHADGTAFAVGAGATVLRYSAGAWAPVALGVTFDSPPTLFAVSGWDAGDVWAVGTDNTILHLEGGTWTRTDPAMAICDRRPFYEDHSFSGVVAVAPDHALVVGHSDGGSTPRGVRGSHRAGVFTCSASAAWPASTLARIDATSPTDAWATGGATLDHWDGFEWEANDVDVPPGDVMMGVHAYAPERALVGASSTVIDYSAGTPTFFSTDTRGLPAQTSGLSAIEQVSVAPDGTVYIVHRSGLLQRRLVSGAVETVLPQGSPRHRIAAVDARRVWSVDGGDALLFDGVTPARIPVSAGTLRWIAAVPPSAATGTEAYVTGTDGVWRVDASGAVTAVADSVDLEQVLVAEDGTLYASNGNSVLRRDGDEWVASDTYCVDLRSFDVNGAHIWGVGSQCSIHFDGTTWSNIDIVGSTYTGVVALSDGRALAVHLSGYLRHSDGGAWSGDYEDRFQSIARDSTHVYFGGQYRAVSRRAISAP